MKKIYLNNLGKEIKKHPEIFQLIKDKYDYNWRRQVREVLELRDEVVDDTKGTTLNQNQIDTLIGFFDSGVNVKTADVYISKINDINKQHTKGYIEAYKTQLKKFNKKSDKYLNYILYFNSKYYQYELIQLMKTDNKKLSIEELFDVIELDLEPERINIKNDKYKDVIFWYMDDEFPLHYIIYILKQQA